MIYLIGTPLLLVFVKEKMTKLTVFRLLVCINNKGVYQHIILEWLLSTTSPDKLITIKYSNDQSKCVSHMDSAKNLLLGLTCLVFSTLTFSLDVFNAWGSFS